MKKVAFSLIICLLTVMLPAFSARAEDTGYTPDFDVSAEAVYLYNLDTETLIYSRNADKPLPPASVTKIMTCILALENTDDLDSEIVEYPLEIQDYLYVYQKEHGNVSKAGLLAGEQLTMRQCLYALMLPSANEVAMCIANHIAGSQEGFADMMNKRAKELGATNTNFVNPNGLYDQNHVTTAHDLFQITRHAMELPGFMDIVTETTYTLESSNMHDQPLTWNTTIEMMLSSSQYYYPTLKGVKTGTLPESGRCFVSTASKDGFTYLLVVLGSDYLDADGNILPKQMAFEDTAKLYDWAFGTFRVKTMVEKGVNVTEIPVKLSSSQDYVQLMTAERFTHLMPNDIEASSVTLVPEIPEHLEAPVKKNDVAGEVILKLNGQELGRVPLLVAENVDASQFKVMLHKIKGVMQSFLFKFIIIFLILLIIIYIFLTMMRNKRRKQSNYRPRRRL